MKIVGGNKKLKYPDDFINQIIHGDCLEVIKLIPMGGVDLIMTDPPYGIDFQSAWRIGTERFKKIVGDKKIDLQIVSKLSKALKDEGALYLFTRWDVFSVWFEEINKYFKIKNCLVWDRVVHGLGDLNGSYAPQYDICIFAVKGKHKLRRNRPKDILRFQRIDPEKLLHPAQKPVDLIEEMILNSSDPNSLILDPFLGSGTSAVAAINANRRFIGIEKELKYCEIALKRLQGKNPNRKSLEAGVEIGDLF